MIGASGEGGTLVVVRDDVDLAFSKRWLGFALACREVPHHARGLSPLLSKAPISLLFGGTTYGNRPADETLAAGFFPRRTESSPAPRGRFALKKAGCSGAPLRCAPSGFIGVALPITVSPSQGIGSCDNKGDRP